MIKYKKQHIDEFLEDYLVTQIFELLLLFNIKTLKYTVYYFNPENGSIKDVESYTDSYTRVGSFDLPEYRRIIHAENGTVEAGFMKLSNHKNL